MYFAEAECPAYRVTHLSRYSIENVPEGDEPQWSLMAEVSESVDKTVSFPSLPRS